MQTLKQPVILTEGEDGYIVARVPIIPGCISQGATVEEALANVREAAELCLEAREEEGWSCRPTITSSKLRLGPSA